MVQKRILFVVNVDWFFLSHRLPLALEALSRGYEVHLACGFTDKEEYIQSLGVQTHALAISRSGMGLQAELFAFLDIYRVLKAVPCDVVHFVTIKPILYGGIASRFLSTKRKVFSVSGLGFIFISEGMKASIIRFFIKQLYKFALGGKNSHVIVQNRDDAALITQLQNITTTIIRGSGVNLDAYSTQEDKNTIPVVTMASRLLKDKGVFEYIQAAKILQGEGVEARFELYGDVDAGNRATLEQDDIAKIKEEKIVKLYGHSEAINKVFENSSIVVLPSYREGLPKVLIEAAASARAVVTTDVAGCRDAIVADITGLLCKVKDPVSLAEAIKKLIKNKKLRDSFGKKGRVLAEKEFDIQEVVRKHFEIYEASI